jgi:hypothetical protein
LLFCKPAHPGLETRWGFTTSSLAYRDNPPRSIEEWFLEYSENYVGDTPYGRQLAPETARGILLESLAPTTQHTIDLLMPPFTYGAQDVLFDGPSNGMVTVHDKGRPIAGRLSHFAQKYRDHDAWLAQ